MLSLVIPVFNEEGAVEDIIRRAHAVLDTTDEIIVVDDGSTDATPGILKKIALPNLHIIRKPHNEGNGAAIMTGVHAAKGEWIATIDADDTYCPEELPHLWKMLQENNADMVVGSREGLKLGKPLHHLARELLRRWGQLFARQQIADINSGLRIVRKSLIERFTSQYPKRFSLHIVLTVLAGRSGARIYYTPISYGPRTGISKLSPGILGPWNFMKFLVLIPWVSLQWSKKE
ncbi:MAG: family 2 glycosyl transferase [Candidatus Peregrinibacteria bacterium Greene1014_49]|nr:MAG: family 2 glycosyl transferase [Candidatus Peregrinibacteria bacterium Greene1014_49]